YCWRRSGCCGSPCPRRTTSCQIFFICSCCCGVRLSSAAIPCGPDGCVVGGGEPASAGAECFPMPTTNPAANEIANPKMTMNRVIEKLVSFVCRQIIRHPLGQRHQI